MTEHEHDIRDSELAPAALEARLSDVWGTPPGMWGWLTTVDHKRIGVRYLVTASAFFVLAGIEALVMRMQLAGPNRRLLSPEMYDQLFSMHGVTMIFLFVTPMLSGSGVKIFFIQQVVN